MATGTLTQMNTRLDAALKTAGDASLARAGRSPSQAVRALWSFAAANDNDPALGERSLDALAAGTDPAASPDVSERLATAKAGWDLFDGTFSSLGIVADSVDATELPDDDTLYEEVLLGRFEERGLS